MNYVTVLITSTHRKMLQFQTRRQAHLPLADVEEVVARLLPRAIDWGERMSAIVVEHAPERRRPAPFREPALDLTPTQYISMEMSASQIYWQNY